MFGEFRINGVTDELNGVEGYDFLEGIECGITGTGVREGDDPRSTRPGDNRGREYIDKDRAFNAVHRGTTAGAYAAVRAHVTAPQNCWTPLRGPHYSPTRPSCIMRRKITTSPLHIGYGDHHRSQNQGSLIELLMSCGHNYKAAPPTPIRFRCMYTFCCPGKQYNPFCFHSSGNSALLMFGQTPAAYICLVEMRARFLGVE